MKAYRKGLLRQTCGTHWDKGGPRCPCWCSTHVAGWGRIRPPEDDAGNISGHTEGECASPAGRSPMDLALLSLPIGMLAVLIIGIPVILAIVVLLLRRAWVPYQHLEPHHTAVSAVFQGVTTLYAIVIAFVVVVLWQQFYTASNH